MSKPTLLFRIIIYLIWFIIIVGAVLALTILFPPPDYAESASTTEVLTDVICAPQTTASCPDRYDLAYSAFAPGEVVVDVYAIHSGDWEANEWSTFAISGNTLLTCGPIPAEVDDVYCGQVRWPANGLTLSAVHAGRVGEGRETGSHQQRWVIRDEPPAPTPTATPSPQPTPVVTSTWEAPTPTPPAPGTNGCFAVEPNLTYYCIFIPITFEIGPDWATFGQGE